MIISWLERLCVCVRTLVYMNLVHSAHDTQFQPMAGKVCVLRTVLKVRLQVCNLSLFASKYAVVH